MVVVRALIDDDRDRHIAHEASIPPTALAAPVTSEDR
jgi:hypothetical protein